MVRQSRFLNFTERWLARNYKRFRYSPVLIRREHGYLDYSFRGVSNMFLCACQDKGAISIVVEFRCEVWDILADFDVITARDSAKGYYGRHAKSARGNTTPAASCCGCAIPWSRCARGQTATCGRARCSACTDTNAVLGHGCSRCIRSFTSQTAIVVCECFARSGPDVLALCVIL